MTPGHPVWTIRPNWKDGILERLEWLTDVLTSATGVEQRRSLRLSPRRSIEITVNPTHSERTFLDLMLHKLGSEQWLAPLWWDKAKLSAAVVANGKRLIFDNAYREHLTGGYALLYSSAFNWEVVTISGQDNAGLDLTDGLDGPWPVGTVVYPLRLSYIDSQTNLKALTSRVGDSTILFMVNEADDHAEVAPDALYLGVPVLATPPNRSSEITSAHTRLSFDRDNTVGLRQRTDNAGRAFTAQSHSWIMQGRKAQSDFRSMLYWMRGRQRAVWLPTYNDDVRVSRAAAQGATNLDIDRIGLGYVGGVIPGRDHLWISGQGIQITDIGAPQSSQEERVRVGAGLPVALPVGRSGSFLDAARLDSDNLELHHYADSDGALECSTTFRSFANTRETAGPIRWPIPAAAMSNEACGVPPDIWFWNVRFTIAAEGPINWTWDPAALLKNAGLPYGDAPDMLGSSQEGWAYNWYVAEPLISGDYMVCSMNPKGTFAGATILETVDGYGGAPAVKIHARRRNQPFSLCPILNGQPVIGADFLQHFGLNLP